MTLVDKLIDWFEKQDYKSWDSVYPYDVLNDFEKDLGEHVSAVEVHEELDEPHRWFIPVSVVFEIEDEFVEFYYHRPSTENQEGGGTSIEVFKVEPREKIVTVYEIID